MPVSSCFPRPRSWLLLLGLVGAACSSSGEDTPGAGGTASGASGAGGSSASSGDGGTAGSSNAGGTAGRASQGGASGRGNAGGTAGSANAGGRSGSANASGGAGARAGSSSGSGGTRSDAGSASSEAGEGGQAGGKPTSGCKRGIAANTTPAPEFLPKVSWWYNWSMQGGGDLEFVPMVWGDASVNTALPAGATFLLGFNEPNFHAQSNLTAEAAAELWPLLEAKAKAAGIPLVSPGMNFCGPADACNNGTSPYGYLKDFFAACTDCQVDYVAVHWYNCDLPSLKDYLEPGGNLEGFEQFGKPIWLTEFSCDGDASVAEQEAYMREAIPYLEASPQVFRYSWFSADPIPNAKLMQDDGTPTALGQVYLELEDSCP